MKTKLILAALPLFLALTGCLRTVDPVEHDFGEAHRWNIEQQVVDPDPVYAGDEMEGGNAKLARDAVDRYNSGSVKQPATTNTTSGTGGGSSGGGGGPN